MPTSDSLLKYLSIIFLFLIMVGCACIAFYDMLYNLPINQYVLMVLGSGIGYALNTSGFIQGGQAALHAQDKTVEIQNRSGVLNANTTTAN